jgi:hypothetical protein
VSMEEKWPGPGPPRTRQAVASDLHRSGVGTSHGRCVARGLADFLLVCEGEGVDPAGATRAQIALFVEGLRTRLSWRGPNVVVLDSGSGLANATLPAAGRGAVVLRLPGRGGRARVQPGRSRRYTPGQHFGAGQSRPLVTVKLPWIPSEAEWLRLLEAFPPRADPQPADAGAGLRIGATS